MRWVLLWTVLVLAAGALLGVIGRDLWRKVRALTAEMTTASDRLAAVSASLTALADRPTARDLITGPALTDGAQDVRSGNGQL